MLVELNQDYLENDSFIHSDINVKNFKKKGKVRIYDSDFFPNLAPQTPPPLNA